MTDNDIFTKVISWQCSWIKRLYDENFHKWKIIPSNLINTIYCENFKFHSCLDPSIRSLKKGTKFLQRNDDKLGKIFVWFSFLTISNSFLPYHQQFFHSFYGLTGILKSTIRTFFSLTLRVQISILSVRCFTKMARLSHVIILNQNTTLKAS